MKRIILSFTICLLSFSAFAQEKYFTRTGHVVFNSETSSEKISANNYQVTSILNSTSGELDFSILIKSFEFEKALMQEHFNDNYMESDKYPKATFKGKIKDFDKLNFSKTGVYIIEVEGDMTIHGVTKKMIANGTLEVKGDELHAKANFPITLKDYHITIPKMAQNKIAKTVQVQVDLNYLPFSKSKN